MKAVMIGLFGLAIVSASIGETPRANHSETRVCSFPVLYSRFNPDVERVWDLFVPSIVPEDRHEIPALAPVGRVWEQPQRVPVRLWTIPRHVAFHQWTPFTHVYLAAWDPENHYQVFAYGGNHEIWRNGVEIEVTLSARGVETREYDSISLMSDRPAPRPASLVPPLTEVARFASCFLR